MVWSRRVEPDQGYVSLRKQLTIAHLHGELTLKSHGLRLIERRTGRHHDYYVPLLAPSDAIPPGISIAFDSFLRHRAPVYNLGIIHDNLSFPSPSLPLFRSVEHFAV